MFSGETPTHGLVGATQSLREAAAIFGERTDSASLAKAFRGMQRARQHLIDADRAHRGALLNLEGNWLDTLCDWANESHLLKAKYWMDGGDLWHTEGPVELDFRLLERSQLGPSNLDQILTRWE